MNRLSEVAKEIVERVPLQEGLEFYGVRFNAKKFARCPFHNEKTGSFSIAKDQKHYKCFGCGEYGSLIDFVMKDKGMDFGTALFQIDMDFGLDMFTVKAKTLQDLKEESGFLENARIEERRQEFSRMIKRRIDNLIDIRRWDWKFSQNTQNPILKKKFEERVEELDRRIDLLIEWEDTI